MKKRLIAGLGLLAAVLAPIVVQTAAVEQEKAARATMAAEVNAVRMALEQYGTDHGGRYPSDAEVAAALGRPLGPNPYGPGPCRLVGARLPAKVPAFAPGTVLYHHDPAEPTYAVTAIVTTRGRAHRLDRPLRDDESLTTR